MSGWLMKLLGSDGVSQAQVNTDGRLAVVSVPPTGTNYTVATKTGTVATAAAAGAAVFAMRLDPGSAINAYVESIRLRWTTIVAFTTPITQTRSIVLTRGSGAAASGGTAIAAVTKKDTSYGASEFDTASGGDVRVATTGALTVTGITFEATNLAEATLVHVGTAGAYYEVVYEFQVRNHPVELLPGQLLAVRVGGSAMDAAGTWSLGVEVSWRESATEI